MVRATQLTGAVAEHGEGAVWWPGVGLCWLDMLRGDILRLALSGDVERWHVGEVVAVARPRSSGGVVIATGHFVITAATFGGEVHEIARPLKDTSVRFNEGACDPAGNLWCGTMRHDAAPDGGILYRIGVEHDVSTALTGVSVSNGLCWSPDGSRAFYVDTPTHRIDAFCWDPIHGLRDRRTFVRIDPELGSPDGLTVDAEGGVWVALWGGGAVHRYTPGGTLSAVIKVPVPKVTSCTFGGAGLDELFITTSRYGEDAPNASAGAVFHADPGVAGLPAAPFRG